MGSAFVQNFFPSAMPVPIYQEHDKTYEIDTCRPVEQAVAAGQLWFDALARGQYPGRRLRRQALPGVKTIGYWDASPESTCIRMG